MNGAALVPAMLAGRRTEARQLAQPPDVVTTSMEVLAVC
jgi:hypothetical protein